MNQDETRAHWGKGEEVWNAWALEMLRHKQGLEDAGSWAVDWFGEGENAETGAWLGEAKADFDGVEFASDASFENYVFPGPAIFDGAHFLGKAAFTNAQFTHVARFQATRCDGDANFKQAKFFHIANFDDAAFASPAEFEKAEFRRETTGPLVPAARFQKTQFASRADFRGAKFIGNAEFIRTVFGGNARFDEAEFQADGIFESAVFEATASLVKTRFMGGAKFNQTRFRREARFGEAEFQKDASFEATEFSGKTLFRLAKIGGDATFQNARFDGEARFVEMRLAGTAIFRAAEFACGADFQSVSFAKPVDFLGSSFDGDTSFEKAVFSQSADFPSAKFKQNVSFADASFLTSANFLQAVFRGRGSFQNVSFNGPAVFSAVQSRIAFVLAGARFAQVPSFHDASFREPPRLDNMTIADPLSLFPVASGEAKSDPRPRLFRGIKACGDPDYTARYRRLRKLASDAQDHQREKAFFAQELRCRRFWQDRPLGRGLARFWLGWLYGGVSDFGRSLMRPLVLWAISIFAFALIYLGQRGAGDFSAAARPAPNFPPWPPDLAFGPMIDWAASAFSWLILSFFNLFTGGGCIAGEGGATAEALYLSLKNSLFFLGWESPDAARRVYACLYGFETSSGTPLVHVPLSVSTTAIVENLVGAIFLGLLLLALRNLLRAR